MESLKGRQDKIRLELISLQNAKKKFKSAAVLEVQTKAGQQMRVPLLTVFCLRLFDTHTVKDNTVVREKCLV